MAIRGTYTVNVTQDRRYVFPPQVDPKGARILPCLFYPGEGRSTRFEITGHPHSAGLGAKTPPSSVLGLERADCISWLFMISWRHGQSVLVASTVYGTSDATPGALPERLVREPTPAQSPARNHAKPGPAYCHRPVLAKMLVLVAARLRWDTMRCNMTRHDSIWLIRPLATTVCPSHPGGALGATGRDQSAMQWQVVARKQCRKRSGRARKITGVTPCVEW
jgi:hypothetical protein